MAFAAMNPNPSRYCLSAQTAVRPVREQALPRGASWLVASLV